MIYELDFIYTGTNFCLTFSDPHIKDLLELTLDTNLEDFTMEDKENLRSQLSSMLPKSQNGDISAEIQTLHKSPSSL